MKSTLLSLFLFICPAIAVAQANVLDFGADPTCSADSTQAIHDAIASTTHSVNFGFNTAGEVYFPPGQYCVSSINATGLSGLHLRATHGTVIIRGDFQSTSLPIIDASGSSSITISGIIVASQSPPYATTGILLSDTEQGGRCNKNTLRDVGSLGHFHHAPLYLRGCTDNLIQGSAFQQDNAYAPTLFIGAVNPYATPSAYQTLAYQWSQQASGENTFVQCEFHSQKSGGYAAVTWLYGTYSIRFFGGNSDANSLNSVHVRTSGDVRSVSWIGTLFYSEGGSPAFAVIDNAGYLESLVLLGVNYSQHNGTSGLVLSGNPVVTSALVGNL